MKHKSFYFIQMVSVLLVLDFSPATCATYAQVLSGRCYSGQKPDESNELQGVSVTLYGAAEEGGIRTQLDADTTGSNGWYGLTVVEGYEHYFIVAGSVSGYSFQSASSVSGAVSGNEIHYSTASAPLSEQTHTGNKFWYTPNTPQNNPPVANNDSATTSQGTAIDIYVLSNDNDPDGDPLHVNSATDPPHGTTTNHGTHVTYIPDAVFVGTDTFNYTAGDGNGGTDTATVTVTVEEGPGTENNPPIADADGPYTGQLGQSITLDGSGSYDPDPGDSIVSYEWDLDNDGQYDDATGVTVVYQWSTAGTKTIGLKVTDSHGASDTDQTTAVISEGHSQTGNITIIKAATPPDSNVSFQFSGDLGSFTLTPASNTRQFNNLAPGNYRVTESLPSGWAQGNYQIAGDLDGGTTSDSMTATVTIDLDAGEDISIVIYNYQLGEIIVEKQTIPDGSTQFFIFTGDLAGSLTDGAQMSSFNLNPGSYSITEDALPGWTLTNISFDDLNSTGDLTTRTASIVLEAGEKIKVVFTNMQADYQLGAIGDWVWNDVNRNGIQDTGETGIQGVNVALVDANGMTIASTQSDGTGYFLFSNLGSGTYSLRFTLPSGYTFSPCDQGADDTVDSDANPTSGETFPYMLSAGEQSLMHDVGMYWSDNSEQYDFGDAPYDGVNTFYPTKLAENGARHRIVPEGPWLGPNDDRPDGEPDGQRLPYNAAGDDADTDPGNGPPNYDDEDAFPSFYLPMLIQAEQTDIPIDVGGGGVVEMWIDFNTDGWWQHPSEQVFSGFLSAGTHTITVNTPPDASPGVAYVRTRISSQGNLSPQGPADDGEVEDDATWIRGLDWGDAPDSYGTLEINNGASHIAVDGSCLGDYVDEELDGQPTADATGDDLAGINDDDGVTWLTPLARGTTAQVQITADFHDTTCTVVGWIDFNQDHDWLDPGEKIVDYTLPGSGYGLDKTFSFNIPANAAPGNTFARFRLYFYDSTSVSPVGAAGVGEVEDYQVYILSDAPGPDDGNDYGDAPDSYKTLHVSGGPYHDIGHVMMGNSVDTELDGQPGPLANGDSDDGVYFPLALEVNQFATILMNVNSPLGVPAAITGWIDYDQSGTFEDPAERIASGIYTGAGVPVSWTETLLVPSTALPGQTYARFRIYRTEPGVDVLPSPTGYGEEGEVEDYRIEIKPAENDPPSGHLITGIKFNDLDGDGVWEPVNGESGLSNWTIWLDTNNDGTPDQTTQTNSQGYFEFSGVNAGTYTAGEESQSGWIQTSPSTPGTYTFTIPGGLMPTVHFMMFGNTQRTGPTGDMDYGDAPDPTYPTLLASNGARHVIGSTLYLGSTIDSEYDGLTSILADGDDQNNSNDEDGVIFSPSIASGQTVSITIVASGAGTVNAWLDFNINGDWGDAGEHIIAAQPVVAGANTFHITVPVNATVGLSFARFRLSSVRELSYTGEAPDGEVEDYAVEIKSPEDGSVTIIKEAIPSDDTKFMFCIQQSSGFFNLLCTHLQDPSSNQWVLLNPGNLQNVYESIIPGWTLSDIQITGDTDNGSVINLSGCSVTVDFDPGENIVITFINEKNDDGGYDYGDAPAKYPDASHELGGPWLGHVPPDTETGTQAHIHALGDDSQGIDDEDCLYGFWGDMVPGNWSLINIKFHSSGKILTLRGWIDFNADGDWDDPHERVYSLIDYTLPPNLEITGIGFPVPQDAIVGKTIARFRICEGVVQSLSPTGPGGKGEVEDFEVEIKATGTPSPPGGIVHGFKFNDLNGNGLWDVGEPALPSWTIWLDANQNGVEDGGDQYTQTNMNGYFQFAGLVSGKYIVGEEQQKDWTQTAPLGGMHTATVDPNSPSSSILFGNQQSGGPTYDGRICGSKWNDLNSDGIPDISEPWLADWRIYLDLNQNGQWDAGEPAQLTDTGGSFEFTGLAVGSYAVAEEMQSGWIQTWPGGAGTHSISVQSGPTQPACVMFGNHQSGGPGTRQGLDYGDAPDPTYPTLLANNGARHPIVDGFHLGANIDGEPDGQPAPDALGDNRQGINDEDGIFFVMPLIPGQQSMVEVAASAPGCLDAWIDFDVDGSWSQAHDRIFASQVIHSGPDLLQFQVPAGIATDIDTYARFRFSSDGALGPDGPAQDGEVEDYHILLGEEGPLVPGEGEVPHVKWSQPPIEIDLNVEIPPVFCGWGEPARSTQEVNEMRWWSMKLDDFRCLGPIPVTRLRWWGSYKAWEYPELPETQPLAWQVCFWTNHPDDDTNEALYPEQLVWLIEIPPERIHIEPVGMLEFPQKALAMCYMYEAALEPDEFFHQAEFISDEDIYWISITAIYPEGIDLQNLWNWTTRPLAWGNPAQALVLSGEGPHPEVDLWPERFSTVESSSLCEQTRGYDMAFELLTEQPWVKWNQPFTNLRDWPYYEDQESFAIEDEDGNVIIERRVGDDWLCERTDPVIAVSWHGSYIGHGYETCKCDEIGEPRRPDYFILSLLIPTNAPAGGGSSSELVWEYLAYDYDEVLVGYDRNPEDEPNEPVFRYSVRLPEEAWFQQERAEQTYWFSVVAVYNALLEEIEHPWGWTNHPHTFGSTAISVSFTDEGPVREPLHDQTGEPVDMSFTLLTMPEQR